MGQEESAGTSWILSVRQGKNGAWQRDVKAVYQRVLAPYVGKTPNTCGLAASYGWRTRLVLSCIDVPSVEQTFAAALRKIYGDAAVSLVENTNVHTQVPTTQLDATWALDRIDTRARVYDGKYLYDDNGAGGDIWVLDTGVRTTHVDFGGRATWMANTMGDGINSDCNGMWYSLRNYRT